MRAVLLGSIWLLIATVAVAAPIAAPAMADHAVAETGPSTGEVETAAVAAGECEAAEPVVAEDLAAWGEANGFEVSARIATSAPSCPPIISCNATHCVETTFCSITDFGSTSCTGHVTLDCPQGTTIKVRKCRCAGGGCQVQSSQTFFCL